MNHHTNQQYDAGSNYGGNEATGNKEYSRKSFLESLRGCYPADIWLNQPVGFHDHQTDQGDGRKCIKPFNTDIEIIVHIAELGVQVCVNRKQKGKYVPVLMCKHRTTN